MSKSIPFIPYEKFIKKYPVTSTERKEGGYAEVFFGDSYAIKIYPPDISLTELSKELNIYNIAEHQCIVKPLAWTFENSIGYLAMPRGKELVQAYKDGDISLRRIIFDILSAVTYLNEATIAHKDIKTSNILYFKEDNRCKLIDMGLASFALLNDDREYYITGNAYTVAFRDPEYHDYRRNNIKAEVYAIATTCAYVESDMKGWSFDDLGFLYKYKDKSADLEWLVKAAILPIHERPNIRDLLLEASKKFDLKLYSENRGVINYTKIPFSCVGLMPGIMKFIISLHSEVHASAIFLAFQILSRTYKQVMKANSGKENILLAYGVACVDLASTITLGFSQKSLFYWKDQLGVNSSDLDSLYTNIIADMLIFTEGIVYSLSYWNYAARAEDLLPILLSLINKQDKIYLSESRDFNNKNIKVFQFVDEEEKFLPNEEKGELLTLMERPSMLDVGPSVDAILLVWNDKSELEIETMIPPLLYNREAIPELNKEWSIKIFLILYKEKDNYSIIDYVLDLLCQFDWRKDYQKVLNKEINPFDEKNRNLD